MFNSMPKYVVSSTLTDPEWNNTTVLSGDVREEVAKLKEQTATSSSTEARSSRRRCSSRTSSTSSG